VTQVTDMILFYLGNFIIRKYTYNGVVRIFVIDEWEITQKVIVNSQIHTQTQHYNFCTFRFIPSRYMFRSIIWTIIRKTQSARTKGKFLWHLHFVSVRWWSK